eukprot:gene11803-11948_t
MLSSPPLRGPEQEQHQGPATDAELPSASGPGAGNGSTLPATARGKQQQRRKEGSLAAGSDGVCHRTRHQQHLHHLQVELEEEEDDATQQQEQQQSLDHAPGVEQGTAEADRTAEEADEAAAAEAMKPPASVTSPDGVLRQAEGHAELLEQLQDDDMDGGGWTVSRAARSYVDASVALIPAVTAAQAWVAATSAGDGTEMLLDVAAQPTTQAERWLGQQGIDEPSPQGYTSAAEAGGRATAAQQALVVAAAAATGTLDTTSQFISCVPAGAKEAGLPGAAAVITQPADVAELLHNSLWSMSTDDARA